MAEFRRGWPVVVAGLYDYTGGYRAALQLTVVCCVVASVLILLMGPYPSFEEAEIPVTGR